MKHKPAHIILNTGKAFMQTSDFKELCQLTGVEKNQALLYSIHQSYREFKIPKANGQYRLIEAPVKKLMQLLHRFNYYLQSGYYIYQTPASYGFIISAKNEKQPKNILENARKHLGHRYMMKMDFKDFFHQISKQRLYKILSTKPFQFNKKTAKTLSNLFTYKARLPMGAPTSPVLSNFACINFDQELQAWADQQQITYTRFADDLTFSTDIEKFSNKHYRQVLKICNRHQLVLNQHKTKFLDENDPKEVTGLILNKTVDIHTRFYQELNGDLKRLKSLVEAGFIVKDNYEEDSVFIKFKQEVKGKINFIGMIEGYNSPVFYRYKQKLKKALLPPNEEVLFARWTHFNYF